MKRRKTKTKGVFAGFIDEAIRLAEKQTGQRQVDPHDPFAMVRKSRMSPMDAEDANREIFSTSVGGWHRGYPV